MAIPKDYIVYVDNSNQTRAVLDLHDFVVTVALLESLQYDGCKVIGRVSSGSEKDAITYGDQVLR